mmetsp:Transcript_26296/g.46641  ORF Transcript_26296/g.46641 Transcript_26296/m.46641 type:complete len:266 (-) Transcript_26296:192-989(-)
MEEDERHSDHKNDLESTGNSVVNGRGEFNEADGDNVVRESHGASSADKSEELASSMSFKGFGSLLEVADHVSHWDEEQNARNSSVEEDIEYVKGNFLPTHEVSGKNNLQSGSDNGRSADHETEHVEVRGGGHAEEDTDDEERKSSLFRIRIRLALNEVRCEGDGDRRERADELVQSESAEKKGDVVEADVQAESERDNHQLGPHSRSIKRSALVPALRSKEGSTKSSREAESLMSCSYEDRSRKWSGKQPFIVDVEHQIQAEVEH